MAKQSLPSLIAKADKITSQYIRQKWADEHGYIKCVTCETRLPWKESHCAHYVERACKATRWLEENLQAACTSCNVFRKERHKRLYTRYIEDTYGKEKLDEFDALERKVLSASEVRELAEEAIKYYSEALKGLE